MSTYRVVQRHGKVPGPAPAVGAARRRQLLNRRGLVGGGHSHWKQARSAGWRCVA